MNWTRLDDETRASEIPGAGCFVKFYTGSVCFVPNVRLAIQGSKGCLVAMAYTHITFASTEGTSTTGWIGNAGAKKSAKLSRNKRK